MKMSYCPSAELSVDVASLINRFCGDDFYREDYQVITSYFAADYVAYEDAIENMRLIAKTGMF